MLYKIISLSVLTILVGCAATENIKQTRAPTQSVHFPAVNIEAEAEIGQTIVSKSNLTIHPAIVVDQDVSDTVKQNILNNRYSGTTMVHAGTYKKGFESPEGSFYPDERGVFQSTVGPVNWPIGIFMPMDSTKSAVVYTYHKTMGAQGFEFGTSPIDVKKTTVEVWGKDSLKKELIYGGLSQKTIAVSYREFSDGTARPAFTQELKYDLTEGDIIGFRGARFQVIKATNMTLKYKVLKPLD